MTQPIADSQIRLQPSIEARPAAAPIAFKPVALPALAAAVHAARQQPRLPTVPVLPAILRKEAFLG